MKLLIEITMEEARALRSVGGEGLGDLAARLSDFEDEEVFAFAAPDVKAQIRIERKVRNAAKSALAKIDRMIARGEQVVGKRRVVR